MNRLDALKVIHFPEHSIKNHKTEKTNKYDITAHKMKVAPDFMVDGVFSSYHYCRALLQKVFQFERLELNTFLDYQVEQMKRPWLWLEYVQLLIRKNIHLLYDMGYAEQCPSILRDMAHKEIQLDRKWHQGLKDHIEDFLDNRFNIRCVRERLAQLDDYQDKWDYLIEVRQEYHEWKPPFLVHDGIPFDHLVGLELERLKLSQKLEQDQAFLDAMKHERAEKIQTTLSVQELACHFRHLVDTGVLVIPNRTCFFKFVAANFSTKNGASISWKSLKNGFDSPSHRARAFWGRWFKGLLGLGGAAAG